MKRLALIFILLITTQAFAQEAFVPVCDRHPKVKEPLEIIFDSCEGQTQEVLARFPIFQLIVANVNPSELKESDFLGLAQVLDLTIIGNPGIIAPMDLRILETFKHVERLHLENIDLSHAPRNFLENFRNLSRLTLKNCNLRAFPVINSSLLSLNLSHNEIDSLPEKFPNFLKKFLETLNLEDNRIVNIRDLLNDLDAIKALFLSQNLIPPLSCEDQRQLFKKRIDGGLSIDTKSINQNCNLNLLLGIFDVKLNGGSVKDFSSELVEIVRLRAGIKFSNFTIDDHFVKLFNEDGNKPINIDSLTFENTNISRLKLNQEPISKFVRDITIRDETRSYLPNIFTGAKELEIIRIVMPNLHKIPEGHFQNIPNLSRIKFEGTPLSQTSKSTFKGILRVSGLPTNFGVTDTGGTSEEWAP